jgi:hypothetical protein
VPGRYAGLRVERAVAGVEGFRGLPGDEDEVSAGDDRAIARARVNRQVVGAVLQRLEAGVGPAAMSCTSMSCPGRRKRWCRFDVLGGMFPAKNSRRTSWYGSTARALA